MTRLHINTIKKIGKVTQLKIPIKLTGKLYRSCLPHGTYDETKEILTKWREKKITHVICLLNDDEIMRKTNTTIEKLYKNNYNVKRIPIRKYNIPIDLTQMKTYLYYILLCLRNGYNVVIHCSAGIGRTGLLYTIFLLYLGYSKENVKRYVQSQLLTCYNTQNPKQQMYINYFNDNLITN